MLARSAGAKRIAPSSLSRIGNQEECVWIVQVYWANEHPRFPAGGKMSQYLESLPIGGEMEVKGPLGHFHYFGKTRCRFSQHAPKH